VATAVWRTVLIGLTGVATGILTTAVALRSSPVSNARTVGASSTPELSNADQKIAQLSERIRRIESGRPSASAGSTSTQQPDDPWKARPPAPADIARDLGDRIQQRLQAHATEGRDPPWATSTEALFTTDLLAAATSDAGAIFKLLSVDCRTTTCTVSIEWPSHEHARRDWQAVMSYPYKKNCVITNYTPRPAEPETAATKYRSTMIFDCEESRMSSASN
jgi:hypothetical protein